ncbi:hypothetical protein I5M32_01425 [Pedobacter sp. SD-b]|uniref:Methylamine utilisation protein MauE domain-containing protein n=1 Tax=Pedobacter segetis TaxID=2793069 RepID=A0ABS1BFI0_9SPHI|nr:MauE/DoxX family redox-associated membrane protein [Pedobacter segetis]MBK0381608.1 hypothetical protein [Pedobacter segetis]
MIKHYYPLIMGIVFIIAGTNHFLMLGFYMKIMPSYFPFPKVLIYLSGVAEIIAGGLLTIKKTRKAGAWLLILLLIAVFPANIQMAINQSKNIDLMFYLSLIRLPFQFLFIYWAYIFTK